MKDDYPIGSLGYERRRLRNELTALVRYLNDAMEKSFTSLPLWKRIAIRLTWKRLCFYSDAKRRFRRLTGNESPMDKFLQDGN